MSVTRDCCGAGAKRVDRRRKGILDVIAAGAARILVRRAPLGKANHGSPVLQMCGASSPEPIITLDGDTAGQRAAMRLIRSWALPLLEAGQILRFA